MLPDFQKSSQILCNKPTDVWNWEILESQNKVMGTSGNPLFPLKKEKVSIVIGRAYPWALMFKSQELGLEKRGIDFA